MENNTRVLEYYGGNGFGGQPEIGEFKIKYGEDQMKEARFTHFRDAKDFYNKIDGQKAFWDCSKGLPELLELLYWAKVKTKEEIEQQLKDDEDLPF